MSTWVQGPPPPRVYDYYSGLYLLFRGTQLDLFGQHEHIYSNYAESIRRAFAWKPVRSQQGMRLVLEARSPD